MHPRYTKAKLKQLWSEETKLARWLQVELAVISARTRLGLLNVKTGEAILTHFRSIKIDAALVARIQEIEDEVQHDMIAFVMAMQETMAGWDDLEPLRGEFHKGITSYDIEDPALMIGLRMAGEAVLDALRGLAEALAAKSVENRDTLMIARTHGQFAEPDTFGRLLKVFEHAIGRSISRLRASIVGELSEGKLSGAVGTYGGIDPKIEEWALASLNLVPAKCETQILQRDRHAIFMAILAVAAGSIEQMSRTFWEMMRSDVGELEEGRKPKQRGSSAMPQKKNPIITERLMGLARRIRGMAGEAFENIATPEGRDISQSSVERQILPDATALVHYMAETAAGLVKDLVVHKDRMEANLESASMGVWAAQRVKVALIEKGIDPNVAYEHTQVLAFEAWQAKKHFWHLLQDRPIGGSGSTATQIIGPSTLQACFDARAYLKPGLMKIFGS